MRKTNFLSVLFMFCCDSLIKIIIFVDLFKLKIKVITRLIGFKKIMDINRLKFHKTESVFNPLID